MKENYLARPSASWKEGKLPGELEILILVHFMKENYLERPLRAGNPYPGAFYEGELPGKAFQELAIVILVHFMKENYLATPSKSWKSLSWCIL